MRANADQRPGSAESRHRRRRRAPPTAEIARRRRIALGLAAGLALIVGVIVGASADEDGGGTATVATGPPPCPETIATDPERLVGQSLIVRMEDDPPQTLLERARRGELGGVILFPTGSAGERSLRRGIDKLRDAAQARGFPAPLVAIDQEGGEVKRLADAPPDLAPAEIGARGDPELSREQGFLTGEALRRLAIDVDLAPVLDVASSPTGFIASRSFGEDPATVAELGTAFAAGLEEANVAASAKHFPGLGEAQANSDVETSVVEADEATLAAALEPFEAAIAAAIPLVMTANAIYPAYDKRLPASLSAVVSTDLLRRRLGYDGVVITDDLGAGAITAAGYDEGAAAVAAATAGADLLLFALSDGSEAAAALERALARGKLDQAALISSCERVSALRERFAAT